MSTPAEPVPPTPVADHTVTASRPAAASSSDAAQASSPADVGRSRSGRVLTAWTVVLAAAVLAVDQLTKWWAESSLTEGGEPIPLVGELLQLRLIYNSGAALSLGTGMTWLLTIVVAAVVIAIVVVIVRMTDRLGSRGWALALGLLLGGAVGNLVDRLLREPGFARGEVVDFLDYAGFFVGNVADIAIVGAAVLIGVLSVMGVGMDGRRESDREPDAQGGADAVGQGAAGPDTDDRAGD